MSYAHIHIPGHLELQGNINLNGRIDEVLIELTELEHFDVSGTAMEGTIPSEVELTNLRLFQVMNAKLSGSIPTEVGTWTNLGKLSNCCCLYIWRATWEKISYRLIIHFVWLPLPHKILTNRVWSDQQKPSLWNLLISLPVQFQRKWG